MTSVRDACRAASSSWSDWGRPSRRRQRSAVPCLRHWLEPFWSIGIGIGEADHRARTGTQQCPDPDRPDGRRKQLRSLARACHGGAHAEGQRMPPICGGSWRAARRRTRPNSTGRRDPTVCRRLRRGRVRRAGYSHSCSRTHSGGRAPSSSGSSAAVHRRAAVQRAAAAAVGVVALRDTGLRDRFGLGWRPELATGILRIRRERIDFVEIIAEDHFDAPHAPACGHGAALAGGFPSSGMASARPRLDRPGELPPPRYDRPAGRGNRRGRAGPSIWPLSAAAASKSAIWRPRPAAPPRRGCLRQSRPRPPRSSAARRRVENIADSIEPARQRSDEPEWISVIVEDRGAGLLLDLHNLYANAVNFGEEANGLFAPFPARSSGLGAPRRRPLDRRTERCAAPPRRPSP